MQTTINGELSSTRVDASVTTLLLAASKDAPLQQPIAATPPADLVEISEQAKELDPGNTAVESIVAPEQQQLADRFHEFLTNLLTRLTNSSVINLAPTPAPVNDEEQSLFAQETNFSAESMTLALNGTIETADGEHIEFSLDMQVMHAQFNTQTIAVQNGSEGLALNYSGAAAELTSTSFNFALSSDGSDEVTGKGIGTFALKDDLKAVREAIKPMAKELFKEAGMPNGWSSVNRLLHVVA